MSIKIHTTIEQAMLLEPFATRVQILIDGEWITSHRDIRPPDEHTDNPLFRIYGDIYVHEVPPGTQARVYLKDLVTPLKKLKDFLTQIEGYTRWTAE